MVLRTNIDESQRNWKFPNGTLKENESDQNGALRNVYEQTGSHAEIIAPLGRDFRLNDGTHRYYLMRALTGFPFELPNGTIDMWWQHPVADRDCLLNDINEKDKELFIQLIDFSFYLYQINIKLGKQFTPEH